MLISIQLLYNISGKALKKFTHRVPSFGVTEKSIGDGVSLSLSLYSTRNSSSLCRSLFNIPRFISAFNVYYKNKE